MDELQDLKNQILKAKTSLKDMERKGAPGLEDIAMEGVDIIPLGGESPEDEGLVATPEQLRRD